MAYDLANSANTKTAHIITQIRTGELLQNDSVRESIQRQTHSTKRSTYIQMNPELKESNIYKADDVSEYLRIAYTRFRLSSHKLRIETGRWSGTPSEKRKCKCDTNSIQD